MPRKLTPDDLRVFQRQIGRTLAAARKSKKLTQQELADRTNGLIGKAAYANYETGHRSLRMEVFWVICEALEVSPGVVIARAREVTLGANGRNIPVSKPLVVSVDMLQSSSTPLAARLIELFELVGLETTTTELGSVWLLPRGQVEHLAVLTGEDFHALRQFLRQHRPGGS